MLTGTAQSWQISVPPSTNALYANTPHGRRKTGEYRAWLHSAGWELRTQFAQPVKGDSFELSIAAPINRRRDLDNLAKPICDLLVELQLIPDDRFVDDIHLKRLPSGDKVRIVLRAISEVSAVRPVDCFVGAKG